MSSPSKRGYVCRVCGKVRRGPNPYAVKVGEASPPRCCGKIMALMGHRQAQAAALIPPKKRLDWIRIGALIMRGKGRRKWRPILSENQKQYAYPLS